jgi:hypothetical protein
MAGQRTWITRVLAVLAALVVTSCATFEKSDVSRADCTSNADCVVKISVVDCKAFWCRADVRPVELRLNGYDPRWELDEAARARGFSLDKDYGIWFKSVIPTKDFDCEPDASMSVCKAKERPSGKRYYYGVQLRGPQAVPLLDPWVVN